MRGFLAAFHALPEGHPLPAQISNPAAMSGQKQLQYKVKAEIGCRGIGRSDYIKPEPLCLAERTRLTRARMPRQWSLPYPRLYHSED